MFRTLSSLLNVATFVGFLRPRHFGQHPITIHEGARKLRSLDLNFGYVLTTLVHLKWSHIKVLQTGS